MTVACRHRADEQSPPGVEGDALAFPVRGRMTKAVISDGAQSTRQDVTQVAGDELGTC